MAYKKQILKIGMFSAILMGLAVAFYFLAEGLFESNKPQASKENARFVGAESCKACHPLEYDLWKASDHSHAMAIATDSTVLGDFNKREIRRNGQVHKFFKRGNNFFVVTDGPEGEMVEFKVAYTFGYDPLQNYLVAFENGKFQTLAWTWDSKKKKWFYMADAIYPGQDIPPDDWLHWTKMSQNWNGMCADCHSTHLKKGFDPKSKSFRTTWSEINVSCEACHGPASRHIQWARLSDKSRLRNADNGLMVETVNIGNRPYVNLCARCHTRRSTLGDYQYEWVDLLDQMIPEFVKTPSYFADGQIKDEDYVFGSFTQSRMYMKKVKCNNCHNVHSGILILDGNRLCLQCHLPKDYDTSAHHFHQYEGQSGIEVKDEYGVIQKVGSGAQCINCHMPGRYYMGVDYRRDHSFRIPRPDLSDKYGTPNACTQCHAGQSNQWAAWKIEAWYGKPEKIQYGIHLAEIAANKPEAVELAESLIFDTLYPPIIRATAMAILAEQHPENSLPVIRRGLNEPESMIRYAAVHHYPAFSEYYPDDLLPLLDDPVRAIRLEAAANLSRVPENLIPKEKSAGLKTALIDYQLAMEYSADFAASRLSLGNLFENTGNPLEAIHQLKEALDIDGKFYPAKVNLAMLYNRLGKNDSAALLLKEVMASNPELPDIYYSLGLLLAEMKEYHEAKEYLVKASALMPENARVFYNLGQIQFYLKEIQNAETSLSKALELNPGDFDCLAAMADLYLKSNQTKKAGACVDTLLRLFPNDQAALILKERLESIK